VYDKKVASGNKTVVLARRLQADEAISDWPGAKIAAPAFGWLAMTCEAFATGVSYTSSRAGRRIPVVPVEWVPGVSSIPAG
jgi:hypothetical protein